MNKTLIKFIRYYVTFKSQDATVALAEGWHEVAMRKGTSKNIRSYDVLPTSKEIFEAAMKTHPSFDRARSTIYWDKAHPDYIKPPRGAKKGVKRPSNKITRIQRTIRILPDIADTVDKAGNGNFSKGIETIVEKYMRFTAALSDK